VLRPLQVVPSAASALCTAAAALGMTGLFVLLVGARLPPRPNQSRSPKVS
jgi:hypothetical protein